MGWLLSLGGQGEVDGCFYGCAAQGVKTGATGQVGDDVGGDHHMLQGAEGCGFGGRAVHLQHLACSDGGRLVEHRHCCAPQDVGLALTGNGVGT